MRKEFLVHFFHLFILFLIISVFKGWILFTGISVNNLIFFWLGGVFGMILPDIDHLIYIYFLKPQELTSMRAVNMVSRGNIFNAISLLYASRYERTQLVFHTAYFQIIFFALTFLVITSSGSVFGKGLVLAFCLHLLSDQWLDMKFLGNLSNWFKNLPVSLDQNQQRAYLLVVLVMILVLGLLF